MSKQVIVVTGASSGFGAMSARALSDLDRWITETSLLLAAA